MKKCITCGAELRNRGRAAKFCEPCRVKRNKELDRESELRKQVKRKKEAGIRYCYRCKKNRISHNKVIKYCELCRDIAAKEARIKGKRRRRVKAKRSKRNDLSQAFKDLNPKGEDLIPYNFDKISSISSASYIQNFNKSWALILKRFGRLEELRDYIIDEYIFWSETTRCIKTTDFFESLKISGTLADQIIKGNSLREIAGIKKNRYTDEDYCREFKRTMSMFDEVPLWIDFIDELQISLYSYARRFNLTGNIYVELLRLFNIPEKDIITMIEKSKKINSEYRKELYTGAYKISDEELIRDFKETFESFYDKYEEYPSSTEFSRIAKYDLSTIRKRLGMTYKEIVQHFNYSMDMSGSQGELVTLRNVQEILNSEYISQATFKWLLSDSNCKLRCDGYFKDYNLVVEFDGEQHFEPIEFFGGQKGFERRVKNDRIKDKLIKEKGMTIIRIAYNEPYWDKEFLKQRLTENGIIIDEKEIA